jgi:hypothetical protein
MSRLRRLGLSRESQDSVGERACLASEIPDVDGFRPAIRGVMVDLAVTGHRKKSAADSLDSTSLAPRDRVVARFRAHHDPLLLHGSHAPSFEFLV